MEMDGYIPKFIRRLMPHATENELREATDRFRQYMGVIQRIYERAVETREADSREIRIQGRFDDANPDI
jgi:hypothetical protein